MGDELIAKTWIDYVSREYPNEEIYIDTCDPGKSALIFKNYKNLIFTNTLWSISSNCIDKSIEYILNLEFLKTPSISRDYGLSILEKASHVHMVGGGYLNTDLWFNYSIPITLAILKRKYNYKLFATGLGMGPVDNSYYKIMAPYFMEFDWIDTRDSHSLGDLSSMGVISNSSMTCDDLFLSIPDQGAVADCHEPRLIIAAQQGGVPGETLSFVAKFIASYPFKNSEIYLLSFDGESDNIIADSIEMSFPFRCRKFNFMDMWNNGFPIRENDIVFTTRFHAHLISSALGAKGYAASTIIPYYDIKHNSLVDIGSGFDLIGMHDFHFDLSGKISAGPETTFSIKRDSLKIMKKSLADRLYDVSHSENIAVPQDAIAQEP